LGCREEGIGATESTPRARRDKTEHRRPEARAPRNGVPMIALPLVALLVSQGQQQIDPVPVPGLPHLVGTPVALGDLDTPPNGLDAGDLVLSDEGERARNTYGFAVLDASNGFESVMQDLPAAHPELGHFAALAVVEGSLMLFDPPLHAPLLQGQTRRIIRGSGGLRLYLTHDGEDEIE